MPTFVVVIERSATCVRRYQIEAATAEDAEQHVQAFVDEGKVDMLGTPWSEWHSDDEESAWEVLGTE